MWNGVPQRTASLVAIDDFFVTRIDRRNTRLPYDILLNSRGTCGLDGHLPRVGMVCGEMVIPVSVTEEPLPLSDDRPAGTESVLIWVKHNKNLLLMHWMGRITDHEVLKLVS